MFAIAASALSIEFSALFAPSVELMLICDTDVGTFSVLMFASAEPVGCAPAADEPIVLVGAVANDTPPVVENRPACALDESALPCWSTNFRPPLPSDSTETDVIVFVSPAGASLPVDASTLMPEITPKTVPSVAAGE